MPTPQVYGEVCRERDEALAEVERIRDFASIVAVTVSSLRNDERTFRAVEAVAAEGSARAAWKTAANEAGRHAENLERALQAVEADDD